MMKDAGCASKHIREFQGSQPGLIGLRERGPTKGTQNPWELTRKREEVRLVALDDLARLEAEQKRIKWEEETRRRMIDDETLRRFKQIKQQQTVEQARKSELLRKTLEEEETALLKQLPAVRDEISERRAKNRAKAKQQEEERRRAERITNSNFALSKQKTLENGRDLQVQLIMKEQERIWKKQEEDLFNQILMKQQLEKDAKLSTDQVKTREANKKLADELQQESRRKEEQKKAIREMNLREEQVELEKIKQQLDDERITGLREKFFRQCKIERNLKECMEERQAAQFLERLREESSAKGILISRDDTDESRALEKERVKKETLQYLDYVHQAKISEKLFENKVEQAAQHALKREAQRVAARKAQEEASRRRLAWETAYVCQQQTQFKEQQRQLEKLMKKHEAEELKTLNDAVQKELSEQITRKRNRIEAYKKELEQQIAGHEIRKAMELAEAERQIEAQNRAEQVLQERIDQAIHSRILDPHRHPWRKMCCQDDATRETPDQTLCGCVFS
ncbi:hypothetical protein T265_06897 [Opisthorchis viverrini]|uniref:Trichohyalin-plectin-homology domain-containing protein n=1 Tax=Opisthorchis viverrini TaxID=6198 RepID=A0A074ZIY9_OPIVI|nr:hypothetical protein T265_06897 [Opisthorchis viverrini]KER25727.1 hypothetical protein T265_06897 [Opisthorchis viverrini]